MPPHRSTDAAENYKNATISTAEDIVSIASKWLLDLKQSWNRTRLIHRLPTEILVSIFRLSLSIGELEPSLEGFDYPSPYSTTGYYSDLLGLCGVCFDWARLVRDTSSFWVYVSSTDEPELVDLALKRSRNSPLWIHYYAPFGHNKYTSKCLDTYLQTILRESHRWHTLILDNEDGGRHIRSAMEQLSASRFSLLSRLFVSDGCIRIPTLFTLGCPALKCVQVKTVNLEWADYQFPDLEVFRLFDIMEGPTLSLSLLLGILKRSPSLVIFDVCDSTISDVLPNNASTPIPTGPVVDRLRLDNVEPSDAIRLLLPHVAIHKNSRLRLSTGYTNHTFPASVDTEDAILAYACQHLSSLIQSTSCPASLYIIVKAAKFFRFNYGDGACDILLGTSNDAKKAIDRIKRLVLSLSPEQRSEPTFLGLDLDEPWTHQLVHTLNDHLNVVELSFSHMVPVAQLSSPDPTTRRWLFPNIRRFKLHLKYSTNGLGDIAQTCPELLAAFLKFAEARSTLTLGRVVGENVPVTLERIVLSGSGKIQVRDFERLEALIPEVWLASGLEIIDRSMSVGTVDR
ncbi:hypothetical protein FRB99_001765 [Tulasnella sp. 403]|nr:hypothetical protein FRB99_001765 [Tulasnella sp. 403]